MITMKEWLDCPTVSNDWGQVEIDNFPNAVLKKPKNKVWGKNEVQMKVKKWFSQNKIKILRENGFFKFALRDESFC